MMEFEPYTANHFNSAPDIHDAYKTYETENLEYFVCTTIRDMFVAHGVHNLFGLTLIHNHFQLEEAEKLVHVDNIAQPWNDNTARKELLADVVPTQWRFTESGIAPFEFSWTGSDRSISDFDLHKHQGFLQELQAFLKLQSLLGIFGVQYLDASVPALNAKDVPVEMTRERVNITLPFVLNEGDEQANFEVLWRFDPMIKLAKCCVGKCLDKQSGHPKSHTHKTC
jgi:hypothetical protein